MPKSSPGTMLCRSLLLVSAISAVALRCDAVQFQAATHFPVPGMPLEVAVADFNGDGRSDFATAVPYPPNETSGTVVVSLSDSQGQPGTTVKTSVPLRPLLISTGDLNKDGKADLVVSTQANRGSGEPPVPLLGNGDGTFTVGSPIYPTGSAQTLCVADVDADGNLDVLFSRYGSSSPSWSLEWYRGRGDGSFESATLIANTYATRIAVGDVNGDGRPDVVTLAREENLARVYLATPTGFTRHAEFSPGEYPDSVILDDWDEDGKLDLLVGLQYASVRIYAGEGTGSFSEPVQVVHGGTVANLSADLDGDTHLDLVAAKVQFGSNDGHLEIRYGNGHGGFTAPISYCAGDISWCLAAGDLNGDSVLDLVAANYTNGISILLGEGERRFTASPWLGTASAVVQGDYDADGKLDLTAADTFNSRMLFLRGNGHGQLQLASVFSLHQDSVYNFCQGNFDGSGSAQFALVCQSYVRIVRLQPNSVWSEVQTLSSHGIMGGRPVAADFNKDGYDDLVILSYAQRALVLFPGSASGLGEPNVLSETANCSFPVRCDWDADGKMDLLAPRIGGTELLLLRGLGNGTFSRSTLILEKKIHHVTCGRWNSDQHLDLAVLIGPNDYSADQIALFTGGAGFTRSGTITFSTARPSSLAADDVNHDGNEDLLVSCYHDGSMLILRGSGAGTFQPAANYSAGPGPGAVVTGDFNSDSLKDIAVPCGLTLLLNKTPLCDIAVKITAFAGAVAGSEANAEVIVSNRGSLPAQDVALSASLAGAFTELEASAAAGELAVGSDGFSWLVDSLPPGESRVIDVKLTPTSALPVHIAAEVGSTATCDLNLQNNAAHALIDPEGADLEVLSITGPETTYAGLPTAYTVAVRNHGPSAVADAAVEVRLSPNLHRIGVHGDGVGTTHSLQSIGPLPAASTTTFTLLALASPVVEPTSGTITGEVFSVLDEHPGNNRLLRQVSILPAPSDHWNSSVKFKAARRAKNEYRGKVKFTWHANPGSGPGLAFFRCLLSSDPVPDEADLPLYVKPFRTLKPGKQYNVKFTFPHPGEVETSQYLLFAVYPAEGPPVLIAVEELS